MSMTVKKLKSGASIAMSIGINDGTVDMTGWTVVTRIKKSIGAETSEVEKTLDTLSNNSRARVGIISTAGLDAGYYFLATKTENSSTGESTETHQKILIQNSAF